MRWNTCTDILWRASTDVLVNDAAQALSEVERSEVGLANAKAQGKGAERQLEATLDELERLKNTLAAATNGLAASEASNHHARSVLHGNTSIEDARFNLGCTPEGSQSSPLRTDVCMSRQK